MRVTARPADPGRILKRDGDHSRRAFDTQLPPCGFTDKKSLSLLLLILILLLILLDSAAPCIRRERDQDLEQD